MKKVWILLGVGAILLTGCAGQSEATSISAAAESPTKKEEGAKTMTVQAESFVQALHDGKIEDVYDQTSSSFKQQVSKAQFVEGYTAFSKGVKSWNHHSHTSVNGSYSDTWVDQDAKRGLVLTTDEKGIITGVLLKPLQSYPDTDNALTKLVYSAPFTGEWYVFWGGQNVLSNYHYEVESQRYAYDLIQVKDGLSYKDDPLKNESYYAFGQEILAPQAGTVVHVVHDIKDNVPVGAMNAQQPAGNVVILDHGNGEFSYFAHLKEGSAKVKVGDHVEKGDLLGLCGNSGNSSEPHLHYQVSDGKDLFHSKSIRVQWEDGLNPRQGESITAK
ncbi:M23 family metallopeptidase [Brevibacillus brevis]|uniref:M23 family metallopeptidase n=1 Tax=Brevibacillus brevis TaxID=1393 RepID=UPI000D1085AE|nr:M23 family metallopeptidase [Brevibacillus brevis]PSJ69574.1 metalloendopeptidase [Brevibacillus brevis]RED23106.1 MecA-like transpeptidase family protein [Brevibacillus brevis]GEC89633.1 peptidase M23 [Brevibacillus brevis]VEF87488.1 putative peptidase [Brevibacillus brevis]